ncbi:hypothetical protein Hanom_Chr11g01039241 [Helianthus anomalus]
MARSLLIMASIFRCSLASRSSFVNKLSSQCSSPSCCIAYPTQTKPLEAEPQLFRLW